MVKIPAKDRNDFQSWKNELKKILNPSVTAIVCILDGQKGKAPIYDSLKKLLTTEMPVPSQVVLAQTISKGRNLRSICNKILIQINAKIGGQPWSIRSVPYFDLPSMIIGYDIHHKKGQKSLLAVCASINQ